MYKLVSFNVDNSVMIVPRDWENDGRCLWPPIPSFKKIEHCVTTGQKPDESWIIHEVTVIKTCDSYQSALEDFHNFHTYGNLEDSTNENEDELKSRERRAEKKKAQGDFFDYLSADKSISGDSSSSGDEHTPSQMKKKRTDEQGGHMGSDHSILSSSRPTLTPSVPVVLCSEPIPSTSHSPLVATSSSASHPTLTSSNSVAPFSLLGPSSPNNLLHLLSHVLSYPTSSASHSIPSAIISEAEHREEVHRIGQQQAEGFTRLEALIRVMAQDLHNIKNQNEEILRENAYLKFLIEGRAAIPPSPTEADISEDFVFPIQEHEELARLEKYLDEDGIGRNKLETYLMRFGGKNAPEFVRRCLRASISDNVLKLYCSKGKSPNGKRDFSQLNFNKAMMRAMTKYFPFMNLKEYQKGLCDWLRHTSDRIKVKATQ